MNWYIIIPFGAAVIAGIIFIIIRNNKDKNKLENKRNNKGCISNFRYAALLKPILAN